MLRDKLTTQTVMAEDKKSIKKLLKNIFGKKEKKVSKIEEKCVTDSKTEYVEPVNVNTIVANFDRLHLERRKERADSEEDLFTRKVIEDDRRSQRTDSQSSQDSGFAQEDDYDDDDKKGDADAFERKCVDETENHTDNPTDDVTTALEDLKIEDQSENENEDKRKKLHTVAVKRTPIRNKIDYTAHPYEKESTFRQIHQVNQRTFSGGQVIVNPLTSQFGQHEEKTIVDQALEEFDEGLAKVGVNLNAPGVTLDLLQELIDEENVPNANETENLLTEFFQDPETIQSLQTFVETEINQISNSEPENPIQDFNDANILDNYENLDTLDQLYTNIYPTPPSAEIASPNYAYQTPPYSDNMSPLSYANNSDYSLSPNSDLERCQEIPAFEENVSEHEDSTDKKARERKDSASSLSMKQYKDMQKEIAASFSKKECCLASRKGCKEIFKDYLKKIKTEERTHLALKVAALDMKMAFGVLQNILWSMSQNGAEIEKQLTLFAFLCERILHEIPHLFLGDEGLTLLKSAVLRCYKTPLLTRYLVQCVRVAIRTKPSLVEGKDCVFNEIDAQGDNLVLACARAGDQFADVLYELTIDAQGDNLVLACARGGDQFADVLYELTAREPYQLPLFNIHHGNTEGYTALHMTCRLHSAASSRLHIAHVLLEHAGVDIWRGDVKGGDTCVHLAVNSATCDLRLILLLFRHLDRKQWKTLAHKQNRSSVTPLELARSAVKSATRQNYPTEVLEFLKKCR